MSDGVLTKNKVKERIELVDKNGNVRKLKDAKIPCFDSVDVCGAVENIMLYLNKVIEEDRFIVDGDYDSEYKREATIRIISHGLVKMKLKECFPACVKDSLTSKQRGGV